ncbi:MAG: hypothetical protein E7473_08370 [Ruminococcaceae bacterium]|nr:hypothetical protein [Oscillospiraceae bacterium]
MAKDISKIDRNLAVAGIDVPDCVFHDIRKPPFKIYGLYKPETENTFRRLPEDVALATSKAVFDLHANTAGGRVRFSTDSEYIAISCKLPGITHFAHMPVTGVSGFDMYVSKGGIDVFEKCLTPPWDMTDGYSTIYHFGSRKMREITINFPLYNDVDELLVGLEPDAELGEGAKYRDIKPIVYYGSSITQGGCASRPGNCYEAIISQKLSCDYINLGFSGSAKCEDAMMDYIANLDMSVFVYDYDHNAPDVGYLAATHFKGYKKVREKNPGLPIIMVTAPIDNRAFLENRYFPCREVIMKSYLDARASGDENVYFVDGAAFFNGENTDACTVDGCHPNDLGFLRMADGIGRIIEYVLFS